MTDHFEIDDLTMWLGMLERVVDTSTNMVVITDADRRIKWVNGTYTRVTGWALHECIDKKPKELLHGPETSQDDLARIAQFLRKGEPVKDVELVNYRKNGDPYRVNLNIEAIRDASGQVFAYLSIQSDVTDRHQQHLDAIELKRRLDVAQRLARLGRIEEDADSGESYWSEKVFRILGMVPDNQPRGFQNLLHHAHRGDVHALKLDSPALFESGREVDVEFRVEGARGLRWIRCRGFPQPFGNGYRMPTSWAIQDITLYKSSLEEKHLVNEQLNVLVQERTKKLQESNQALEDFSYALSHDLRTPVRHVAGFSELIAESIRSGNTQECLRYCEKIANSARKMQELIEGMLSFAKAGREGIRVQPIELSSMVREAMSEAESSVPDHRVSWEVDPDLPLIQGDPVLLREVWLNLLENAVKYSSRREQIRVHIGWQPRDAGWEFVVQDNGAGFDPQHASKLFGMFHRLHGDEQFKGTGVGLALVRRILESHGGRIWAVSSPDKGASFHFYLPLLSHPVVPAAAEPSSDFSPVEP